MKGKMSSADKADRKKGQSDFVLQIYKRSDESARMDLYMTYRDMRESFGNLVSEIEGGGIPVEEK